MRQRRLVLLVLALLASLLVPASAQQPPPPLTKGPYSTGYLPTSDGTLLRYTVFLPPGDGPFPTLMQYDVYAAGTNPEENAQGEFADRMLAAGYALLGVSVRGSGCSTGTFDVFSERSARDGYEAVEWAAKQPWSNGNIGMYGVSYPAIMSLYVAALRPPHLRAIAPGAALSDLYRDVAYPGGILNTTFVGAWTALQKTTGYQDAPLVVANDSDPRCLADVAQHQQPDKVVIAQAVSAPYADDPFWNRSLGDRIADIKVPALTLSAWQDEQVGGRVTEAYHQMRNATSWHVVSNGHHGTSISGTGYADLEKAFFDHFVAGADNGFERTPHVQVWHEWQTSYDPRWVTGYRSWPEPSATTFNLTADGGLTAAPATVAGSASYPYPGTGTSMLATGYELDAERDAYLVPSTGVSFTTGAFDAPMELFGPASADLWISSTADDTDLQVTLSEIRPDGQEEYVQRGWLRASHRALDASRSTETRPFHPHSLASVAPLSPGVPTAVRVEIWPVGHVFRAGSRLRLTVEPPGGTTGMRSLRILPTPAIDTVYAGPATPSRLVLSTVPALDVVASYPECGTVMNQPCRPAS